MKRLEALLMPGLSCGRTAKLRLIWQPHRLIYRMGRRVMLSFRPALFRFCKSHFRSFVDAVRSRTNEHPRLLVSLQSESSRLGIISAAKARCLSVACYKHYQPGPQIRAILPGSTVPHPPVPWMNISCSPARETRRVAVLSIIFSHYGRSFGW